MSRQIKKYCKKILSVFLALVMLFLSIPLTSLMNVNAATWTYTRNNITKLENAKIVNIKNDIDLLNYRGSDFDPGSSTVSFENSFTDFGKDSRIVYTKAINVSKAPTDSAGHKIISFVFCNNDGTANNDLYVYAAQYNSSWNMVDDGDWTGTGTEYKLHKDTEWIVLCFRLNNGNTSYGAGTETQIKIDNIINLRYCYCVIEPWDYTFDCNGGNYNGKSKFTQQRLGVTEYQFPSAPTRTGYRFDYWELSGVQKTWTANEIASNDPSKNIDTWKLFTNCNFVAHWTKVAEPTVLRVYNERVEGQNYYYSYAYIDWNGSTPDRVQFPSWTNINGQDDLFWYTNGVTSGTWTKNVNGETLTFSNDKT